MSERETDTTFLKLFKSLGYTDDIFLINHQKFIDPGYNARMAGASKHSATLAAPYKGFSDFCIVSKPGKLSRPLVIIVECKASINNHKPISEEKDDIKKYATSGVKHYMNCFWTSGLGKEDVVGIAFSGGNRDNTKPKISFFGICSQHNKPKSSEYEIKDLGSEDQNIKFTLKSNIDQDDLLSLLYCFADLSNDSPLSANGTNYYKIPCSVLPRITIEASKVQRAYNEGQMIKIRDELLKLEKTDVVPKGVLQVIEHDFTYEIIDGQHRLRAYKELSSRGYIFDIVIQLIIVTKTENIADVYVEHNKAMAASEFEKGGEVKSENLCYIVAVKIMEKLQNTFTTKVDGKQIFNESWVQTKKPKLSRHERVDELKRYFEIDDTGKELIKNNTTEELIEMIMKANKLLPTTARKVNGKGFAALTIRTCENFGCYLGLVDCSEWFVSK